MTAYFIECLSHQMAPVQGTKAHILSAESSITGYLRSLLLQESVFQGISQIDQTANNFSILSASPPLNTKSGDSASLRGGLERFCAAWQNHATTADRSLCAKVFREVNQLYEDDHRHYHGPGHIHHCLKKLDDARRRAANSAGPDLNENQFSLIELAIWFHDVIYTAGESDNESRSAHWFQEWAKGRLESTAITRINSLIAATEHKAMPSGDLEKLMVDIDLSSFSLARQAFLEDGRSIRQEFKELSDHDFVEGQSMFLRKLLDRPSIYSTSWYRRHCEATAQQNIRHLLEMYEQGFKPRLTSLD